MSTTTDDPGDLRRELLRALYLRRAGSFTAHFLATTINRRCGTEYTEHEVRAELKFSESRGWTVGAPDELGSTIRHELTADGILFCERNDLTA